MTPTDDWMDLARAVGVDRTPIYAQVLAEHRVAAGIDASAAELAAEAATFLGAVSPACAAGTDRDHARCSHPANHRRYGGCGCPCHGAERGRRADR